MAFARSPASTGRGWYVFPASSAPRRAARIVDVRGGLSRGFFGRSGTRRSGTGADSTDARGASAPAGQRRHIAAPLSATEAARARWRCRRYVGMGASSRGRPWTGRSLQRRPPSRHCHEALLAVRLVASRFLPSAVIKSGSAVPAAAKSCAMPTRAPWLVAPACAPTQRGTCSYERRADACGRGVPRPC